ncbi:non-hydrolyzing UDP-N-acetylglucosamine 2-epimerase [Halobium salinum]|uniref:Non-hydrolyzing UDP-N-acetylglucosamine 2-epimerase n=1 Tax=Halobium salinum TaxID=1364940 RepID=A0ABD5PB84_9EURY|nr:UDP-N-acetylglucosamine 2-epimerase (non-hydrolyzing) [Halobium salinum]
MSVNDDVAGEAKRVSAMLVVGTRPEIVKAAPVVRAAEANERVDLTLVHTNQHYDAELSDVFFETLELDPPSVDLEVGSGSHGEQTADALVGVERLLQERDPDVVLAVGDTNTVLSTALAASKLPVAFGHVEAGIRSGDLSMPEEVNRILADHVGDLLFAPTEEAATNLTHEGIDRNVRMTGNTVVDACRTHARIAESRSDVLDRFGLEPEGYAVATVHRPRNTDDPDRLASTLEALDDAPLPVVFPVHPRTRSAIDALDFESTGALRTVEPLDYLDFLALLSEAQLVVTDSGGVQEEASILERPCLTVRPNTERPETVDAGVNELVEPADLAARIRTLHGDEAVRTAMTGHPDLYGDGRAGERIVDTLVERFEPEGGPADREPGVDSQS